MTDPILPDIEPDYDFLDREYSDNAREWARNRAATKRHGDITLETRMGYTSIQFPSPAGCRHAALVVCGRLAADPSAAAEVLKALGLTTILRAGGGDGRVVRRQDKPLVSHWRLPPLPIGYGPDDYGQVGERPRKRPGRKPAILRDPA